MSRAKKPVHKYDANGNYLKSYESIAHAALNESCDESTIRKAAHTGGFGRSFLWSFERADSIWDTNIINRYAESRGVDPSEIVKGKVYQTVAGDDRVSIETKPKQIKDEKELEIQEFQKLQKQKQRKTDELNVVKKKFREFARVENTLTALNEALIEQLTSDTFKPITYEHPKVEGTVLVVQVTDAHFNELVEMPDNEYGFVVGAKRLQKFAHKVRRMAEMYKTKEIVLALTGDLINSDRRLDEIAHMSTNRTKAALIATQILYHFIQDINRAANISIVSVSGNESRIKDEWGMSNFNMSDNYDYMITNMLKLLFKDAQGVCFIEGDPVEQVINVNNSNILVTHGTTIKEGQGPMQQIFGKYSAKGILLDYAIFGHVHFTNITDIYSRSGSLIGNNIYSDRGINLVTKASQVIHVIEPDGGIDSLKVSLQYTEGYQGYDIKDDLEAYNAKLADNTKPRETIVKVII
jgi:predicted phosphodiesterase